jgi:hypothetical protein
MILFLSRATFMSIVVQRFHWNQCILLLIGRVGNIALLALSFNFIIDVMWGTTLVEEVVNFIAGAITTFFQKTNECIALSFAAFAHSQFSLGKLHTCLFRANDIRNM